MPRIKQRFAETANEVRPLSEPGTRGGENATSAPDAVCPFPNAGQSLSHGGELPDPGSESETVEWVSDKPFPSQEEALASIQEQAVVYTETTPNGTVIGYSPAPRRYYTVNDVEVPSVTTVLKILHKNLAKWGMRIGVAGVENLLARDVIQQFGSRFIDAAGGPVDTDDILRFLDQEKLTVNDVSGEAQDRGSRVHKAMENWAKSGIKPFILDYPDVKEEEAGYFDAFNQFLEHANPEPLEVETMVGSVEHGFAGRCDLVVRLNETRRIRRTPKRDWDDIEPGRYRMDVKTREKPRCYPETEFRQLAAYEGAAVECGYQPTDAQFILCLGSDGSYIFKQSTATFDDFLQVLAVYQGNGRM